MAFNLRIHSRPRSKDSTIVCINHSMTPKDVIHILKIESGMMKNSNYGLMVAKIRNKYKWLVENEEFSKMIIDEEDIIFTQPYRKVIAIELPDQTCVRRNVDLRSPTENVVKELCFHFKIHPYEIWGAYYDARGENILIIPNQSISEQVPDIQRIYLKQYLFPENLKPDYLSPFNMYIFQYRAMIIQGQFGNDPEDQIYLKGKSWYNSRNITNGYPHSETSRKKELINIFSMKTFGSVNFIVRFHETTEKNNYHLCEKLKRLTIVRKALFLTDIDDNKKEKVVVPFSSIKYVGIRDEFLKITFGSKEWYFLSHRSSEIDVIICQLMKKYHFTFPLTNCYSDLLLPRSYHFIENQIYFLPDNIYTTEELIQANMSILARKYAKLVNLQNDESSNEDYPLTEISINSSLDELTSIIKSQNEDGDTHKNDKIFHSIDNAKLMSSIDFEDQSLRLDKLKKSLLKINELLNKENENTKYRRIKKILKRSASSQIPQNVQTENSDTVRNCSLSFSKESTDTKDDQNNGKEDIFGGNGQIQKLICDEKTAKNINLSLSQADIKANQNELKNKKYCSICSGDQIMILDDHLSFSNSYNSIFRFPQKQSVDNLPGLNSKKENCFNQKEQVDSSANETDDLDIVLVDSSTSQNIKDNEELNNIKGSTSIDQFKISSDDENNINCNSNNDISLLNKQNETSSSEINEKIDQVEISLKDPIQASTFSKDSLQDSNKISTDLLVDNQSFVFNKDCLKEENSETDLNQISQPLIGHSLTKSNCNNYASVDFTDSSAVLIKDDQTAVDDKKESIFNKSEQDDQSSESKEENVKTSEEQNGSKCILIIYSESEADDENIEEEEEEEKVDYNEIVNYNLISDTGISFNNSAMNKKEELIDQPSLQFENEHIDVDSDAKECILAFPIPDQISRNKSNSEESDVAAYPDNSLEKTFENKESNQCLILLLNQQNLNNNGSHSESAKNEEEIAIDSIQVNKNEPKGSNSSIDEVFAVSKADNTDNQNHANEIAEIDSIESNKSTNPTDKLFAQQESPVATQKEPNEVSESFEKVDNKSNSSQSSTEVTKTNQSEDVKSFNIVYNSFMTVINRNKDFEGIKNNQDESSKSSETINNAFEAIKDEDTISHEIKDIQANPNIKDEINKDDQNGIQKADESVNNVCLTVLNNVDENKSCKNSQNDITESIKMDTDINVEIESGQEQESEVIKDDSNESEESIENKDESDIKIEKNEDEKSNEITKKEVINTIDHNQEAPIISSVHLDPIDSLNNETSNQQNDSSETIKNIQVEEDKSNEIKIDTNIANNDHGNEIECVKQLAKIDDSNINVTQQKDSVEDVIQPSLANSANSALIDLNDQIEANESHETLLDSNKNVIVQQADAFQVTQNEKVEDDSSISLIESKKEKEVVINSQQDKIDDSNGELVVKQQSTNEIIKNGQDESDILFEDTNHELIQQKDSSEMVNTNQSKDNKSHNAGNFAISALINNNKSDQNEIVKSLDSNSKLINCNHEESDKSHELVDASNDQFIQQKETVEIIKNVHDEDSKPHLQTSIVTQESSNKNNEQIKDNKDSIEVIDNTTQPSLTNYQFKVENIEDYEDEDDESSGIQICSPLVKDSQRYRETHQNFVFSPTKTQHDRSSKLQFVTQNDEKIESEDDENDSFMSRKPKSPSHRRIGYEKRLSSSVFQRRSPERFSEFPNEIYDEEESKQALTMSQSRFKKQNKNYNNDENSEYETTMKESMMSNSRYNELNDQQLNGQTINNYYNMNMTNQHIYPQSQSPYQSPQRLQIPSPSQSLQPDQFRMQLQNQNQQLMNSPSQNQQQQQLLLQSQQLQLQSMQGIPVPCFNQVTPQFVPFNQSMVSGFQLSPGLYSPSPAASPSTHIEASPQITVNVGGSKGRKSKRNKKSSKRKKDDSDCSLSYSSDDEGDDYEYNDDSSDELSISSDSGEYQTTNDLINEIETNVEKIIKKVNSKKKVVDDLRTLGNLLALLERRSNGTPKSDVLHQIIKKIKKKINRKSNKKHSYISLMNEITKTINTYFSEYRASFKDVSVRKSNEIIKIPNNNTNIDELQKSLLQIHNALSGCQDNT